MDNSSIYFEKIKVHWTESSNSDFQTMTHLYNSKDYHWSLFMGHLVVEKLLKALYIKKHQKHPLPIHDLLRLTKKFTEMKMRK